MGGWSRPARVAVAVAVLAGPTIWSRTARADDAGDDEIVVPGQPIAPPASGAAPQQVIVVVQQAPTQEPGTSRSRVPRAGDPHYEVEAYLADLKNELRDKQEAYRAARRGDSDAAEEAARDDMVDANRFYKEERSRLTKQEPGLIAGGATLVGLGGASFVTSAVLALVWGLSEATVLVGGNPDNSGVGYAALGCLAGGFIGVGAGVPMLVIGLQRVPREPGDASLGAMPIGFAPPPVGATVRWSF